MGNHIHMFKTQAEYEANKQNITPPFIACIKENNKMGMHADKTVETLFNFQRKNVNIVENGSFTIEPDSNYGALSSVNVKVNVPTSDGPTGGGVSKSLNDIIYYDYDGTVLYSYTKNEFLALENHPELPSHPRLICQGWNYEFTKAQEYVTKYGKVNIGATYITDDGKTRLYIRIAAEGRMDVPLYFSQTVANGVVIDWGDGNVTQTLSGTGNVNTTHKYASIGDYCITLSVRNGCVLGLGHNSSTYCVMGSTNKYGAEVYNNMLQHVEIGSSVTSIGRYAFNECHSLALVVIPYGVRSIGDQAFNRCYSLASVVIPEGVRGIGNYMLENCYSLTSVVIPDGVTSINGVFENCYSLASVVIPESVTSIGVTAFFNCSSLTSMVIPNGVRSIDSQAFYQCYSLASVVIPESVRNIGNAAFQSCYSLASVVIPNGVTNISNSTFGNCYSLASVVIPESVTSIGTYAFNNCYSLASVVIPENVTSIGTYAFSNCYSIASVVIPNGVTNISNSTFSNCYSLASVVIPESVISIGNNAFYNCYSLASVVIPNGITSIADNTFCYCYSLASMVIPESVTSIGTYAFRDCYSLASVVIPYAVTSVGNNAFYQCYGMAFYDFSTLTAIPSLSSTNVFSSIPSDCKIIVPDALYDEWIAATNWSTYASKIIKKSDWDAL